MLYRMIQSAEEWTRITTTRDLSGWYRDPECTEPATAEEVDKAGDDIYTEGGWNVEPPSYPALVHIEA